MAVLFLYWPEIYNPWFFYTVELKVGFTKLRVSETIENVYLVTTSYTSTHIIFYYKAYKLSGYKTLNYSIQLKHLFISQHSFKVFHLIYTFMLTFLHEIYVLYFKLNFVISSRNVKIFSQKFSLFWWCTIHLLRIMLSSILLLYISLLYWDKQHWQLSSFTVVHFFKHN